jgi:Guanylate-binding protein, N-terminal domain
LIQLVSVNYNIFTNSAQILQIVVTGDSEIDGFALNSENLSSILGKVPHGTKVAVVSVVGAFRTGKSFLLNFFLRYLRCDLSAEDLTEDWLMMDGKFSSCQALKTFFAVTTLICST